MAKRQVDWQAIGLAYAGGVEPVAQIARKHGVATASIYAKAKREGWGRPAGQPAALPGAARTAPPRARAKPARRGSKHAMRRMIGLVNRLADELSENLDQAAATDTPPTDQKAVADILNSLTRALKELTALEREASRQITGGVEQSNMAGANDASDTSGAWDELQRRLARLAAGKTEE